jgi:hypothetical protein
MAIRGLKGKPGMVGHIAASCSTVCSVLAGAGGDYRDPFGCAAEHLDRGRISAGYEASGWWGVGAPKNTPAEIVEKLNKEINAALADSNTTVAFSKGF